MFLWDSEEGFQTYSTFRIWTMICDLCLHKMRALGTVLSSVAKSIGVFERVVPYHSLWGWGLTNIGYGGLVLRLFCHLLNFRGDNYITKDGWMEKL